MEDSLLLSSMSPKVKKNTGAHNTKRKVTKLALSKQIRHSLLYRRHSKGSNIIILDDFSSETLSSRSSSPVKKLNSTPIIISDSDDDICRKPPPKCYINSETESETKRMQIKSWIANVNAATNLKRDLRSDFNICTDSAHEEIQKLENNDSENNKSSKNDLSVIESSLSKSIIEDSFVMAEQKQEIGCDHLKSNNVNLEDDAKKISIVESSDENVSYMESVLDELYGDQWRANEKSVFTNSEPRKQKKNIYKDVPQSERKTPHLFKDCVSRRLLFNETDRKAANSQPTCKEQHVLRKTDYDNKLNQDFSNLQIVSKDDKIKSSTNNSDQDFDEYFNNELNSLNLEQRIRKRNEINSKSGSPFHKINHTPTNEQHLKKENLLEVNVTENNLDKIHRGKLKKKTKATADSLQTDYKVDDYVQGIHKRVVQLKNGDNDICSIKSVTFSFLASLSVNIPIHKCDPSALIYRNNYKQHREKLAETLFKLYNETVFDKAIPEDTPIVWNTRMRGSAGFCYCRRTIKGTEIKSRSVRIALSTKVLDSADRLRDTLIHELCHAATWMVNHVSDGHGPQWKAWATKAMNTYPELPPIKRCHDYEINTKYTYRCTDCGYSFGRHTKSLNMEKKRCGYCLGKFEILINKTSKTGKTQAVLTTPKREATGFALFVKENYAQVKTPQLSHGDVMRILGENFQACKISK